MNKLKKGQVYYQNATPGFRVEITDEITTPNGPEFVGQCYLNGRFKAAWLAPSEQFRFGDFTLDTGKDATRTPEKMPKTIAELVGVLEEKFGKENIAYLGRFDSCPMDAFGDYTEPTPHQIHWVRENREWLAELSKGVFTAKEIFEGAQDHASILASPYMKCECGNPECPLAQITARFPKA